MKRTRTLALLSATALSAAVFLSFGSAQGDEAAAPKQAPKPPPPKTGETRYDPDNVTGISQYMERILEGNKRFLRKDYNGAYEVYRKAAQLNPKQGLGPYLMGEVSVAQNNTGEAEASFKQAETLVDAKDPILRGAILFAMADLFERQKKWDQAKTAWRAYSEFAAKQTADGGAHLASAEARIKAIDDALKLDADYVKVRERIAKEGDGGASRSSPKK